MSKTLFEYVWTFPHYRDCFPFIFPDSMAKIDLSKSGLLGKILERSVYVSLKYFFVYILYLLVYWKS